jgi:bifunctional non-homologous end joining protein LigD
MRFYARLAPVLLPAIADRPLVLRRYPEGIEGQSFHQHDPGARTPPGVRVEQVVGEPGTPAERRLVGADPARRPGEALATLLYTVQLGTIPVNAWHSRVRSIASPDYAVLDLDPDEKAGFAGVVTVGKLVHAALVRRGLDSVPKTSGSRGLHMLIPLPKRSTYDDSAALAEEVATEVANERPELATVERSLDERRRGTVYVDHMQNAAGKTLAAVFAVRARPDATVSTPLSWRQVGTALRPERFTIASVARRRAALMARWSDAWARQGKR